jgi:peptidoglycan/xylan/chitin deacetylase (PgdA/CDA1 family)
MGTLAHPPREKEWIHFQFYHFILDDEREIFRRQLQSLRRFGDFISIDDAVDALASKTPIGGRYFCVTFDDGLRQCLTNVVPILQDLQVPAAFFIPTKYIGLDLEKDWEQIAPFYKRSWRGLEGGFEFLDWNECLQIADAGFSIGSHTHSHPRLTELKPVEAEAELAISKQEIEAQLGKPCRHFCCPWGKVNRDFDPAVHPLMAKKVGYDSFITTEDGRTLNGDTPFYIRRFGCESDQNPALLKYALFSRSNSVRANTENGKLVPVVKGL